MKKIIFTALCLFIFLPHFVYAQHETDSNSAKTDSLSNVNTIVLSNGYEIPVLGIRCSGQSLEQTIDLVYTALCRGIRLFETDGDSISEDGIGHAVRKAIDEGIITRQEVFVTTMFTPEENEDFDVLIENSINHFGLDYIDLMFLRQNQFDQDSRAWKAMERAAESGKIKSIGFSGFFDIRNFDLFVNNAVEIIPTVLQIDVFPYRQRQDMQAHISQYGMVLESLSPLGMNGEEQVLFADPVISEIATWHQVTSPQVILRWQIQNGVITVPNVTDIETIEEITAIFDFQLSEAEFNQIAVLDRSSLYDSYLIY